MIAWTTWNAAGYSVKTSKAHIESEEYWGLALCGTRIPRAGNGIEYTNESDGECKRCEKKARLRSADDRGPRVPNWL